MWLFKHGKISILLTLMIFVIRYFRETHGKTFSWRELDVLKDRGKKSLKTKTEKTDGTFPNVLSQQQPLSGQREGRGKALEDRILLVLS